MIKIPDFNEKDLEIYQGKNVIINEFSTKGKKLYNLMRYHNIKVIAFCVDDHKILLTKKYENIPVIRMKNLSRFVNKYDHLIMQPVDLENKEILKLKEQTQKLKLEIAEVDTGLLMIQYNKVLLDSVRKNNLEYQKTKKEWLKIVHKKFLFRLVSFVIKKPENPILVCLPMKTADYSIDYTLEGIAGINTVNLNHRPRFINQSVYGRRLGTIKIITAVREPISQNLSAFYQGVGSGFFMSDWILAELENNSEKESIEKLEEIFIKNGDNVQILFDEYIKSFIYKEKNIISELPRSIQSFLSEFEEYALDITKYPFDKEKGYAIIKEGNIEVFVYQLEKLNNVVLELSEWTGVKFSKLINGNQASDKWIGKSYKQAQNEIKISQEYFDKCFDEPYVKHCYSEIDIQKFKEKWKPNIAILD